MAGTLTISTLSDGTNSTSSTNCIQGSAKAWCNWNGNTASINASYNVSSVTRNSSGNYTLSFTNAFADTNYACAGMATASNSTTIDIYSSGGAASAPTLKSTTQCRFVTEATDSYDTSVAIFR